jgi:hypothetical protein
MVFCTILKDVSTSRLLGIYIEFQESVARGLFPFSKLFIHRYPVIDNPRLSKGVQFVVSLFRFRSNYTALNAHIQSITL